MVTNQHLSKAVENSACYTSAALEKVWQKCEGLCKLKQMGLNVQRHRFDTKSDEDATWKDDKDRQTQTGCF